jgi:hypothetical protein
MSNAFLGIINSIDIFGKPISLRINKMETSKTFFGGLLTIVLIIAMFSMFMLQLSDLFDHKFPTGNLETTTIPNPSIIINSTKMPFSFYISDYDNYILSGEDLFKYFRIEVTLRYSNNSNQELSVQHIALEDCKIHHFPNLTEEEFLNAAVENFLCLPLQDYPLFGAFDQSTIQFMAIYLYPCNNKTSNVTCNTQKQVDELLKSNVYYFNVVLQNERINIMEYIKYSSASLYTIYKAIRGDTFRQMKLFLSESSLKSDNGFLFEEFETYETVTFERVEYDDAILAADNCYFSLELFSSRTKFAYYRKYVKLPTILANLGGLSSIIQISFSIAASFFSILKRNEHILNKIFDFDLLDEKKVYEGQRILSNLQKNMNLSMSSSSHKPMVNQKKTKSNSRKHNLDNSLEKQKSKILKENKNHTIPVNLSLTPHDSGEEKYPTYVPDILKLIEIRNTKSLKFNFFEMLKYMLCKCCVNKKIIDKFQLYQKSSLVLDYALDITHIIGKLEELEKLKIVILSKHQLALFNFISKYLVSQNKNKEVSSNITKLYALNNDKEALIKLLLDFKINNNNENHLTPVDKKLYSFLSDELKIIFGVN